MEFPDLSSETGVQFLDDYLSTRSYVSGYEASKNDQLVWAALKGKEPGPAAVNARRWYRHVAFFSGKNLPESDEKIRITVSNSVSDPKVEVQTQLLCLNLDPKAFQFETTRFWSCIILVLFLIFEL